MARTTIEGVDPARSAQMARVRGRDTKPELRVRRLLHAAGLRFRLHDHRLPGTPDLVFPSRRIALFVHGCFWHRHGDPACKRSRLPKSRLDFWEPKLEGNRRRDEEKARQLEERGWRVMVIWECELQSEQRLLALADEIGSTPTYARGPGGTATPRITA